MTDRTNLKVVKHKAFPVDPVAAGRKGVQAREAKVMDHLTETRQYVNTLAMPAAQYVGDLVKGVRLVEVDGKLEPAPVIGDKLRLDAARDILDRTIGKAAQELRVGPSEQTLDIIRELDERGTMYDNEGQGDTSQGDG